MKRRVLLGLMLLSATGAANALGLCAGPRGCTPEQMEEARKRGEIEWKQSVDALKYNGPAYSPEDEGKVRRVYKDLNGDIVVERYGDGGTHDVYKKNSSGEYERW